MLVIAYALTLRTSPILCPVTSISYFERYAETLSKKAKYFEKEVMSNNAEKVSYKVVGTVGHKTGNVL